MVLRPPVGVCCSYCARPRDRAWSAGLTEVLTAGENSDESAAYGGQRAPRCVIVCGPCAVDCVIVAVLVATLVAGGCAPIGERSLRRTPAGDPTAHRRDRAADRIDGRGGGRRRCAAAAGNDRINGGARQRPARRRRRQRRAHRRPRRRLRCSAAPATTASTRAPAADDVVVGGDGRDTIRADRRRARHDRLRQGPRPRVRGRASTRVARDCEVVSRG